MYLRWLVLLMVGSLLVSSCDKQRPADYGHFLPKYYQQEISYLVENALAHQYLHDSDSAYTDSIGRCGISILDFYTQGQEKAPYLFNLTWHDDGSPDWPQQPASIKLSSFGAKEVWVSSTSEFEDYQIFSSNGDSTEIYNLIPQTVYWYRMVDSSDSILYQSVFKTLGQLRMIKTNNTPSVRDIGGWPCNGGRLAYGKIIRGGSPEYEFFNQDLQQDILSGMIGIDYEIDLRRETELCSCPFSSKVRFENIELAHYMNLIDNIHQDTHKNLARCLKVLRDNLESGKCTYIHCHAGADRTGSVIAIIQALCGVSEKDIVKDWEINSFNSRYYFKLINQEKALYQHVVDNISMADSAEMRSFIKFFYDNYGGRQGVTLKDQVEIWLKEKIFHDQKDHGSSIIDGIRNHLIEKKIKSPMVVKAIGEGKYAVALDNTQVFDVNPNNSLDTDSVYMSDFLNCEGYTSLWVNLKIPNVAVFYDIDKNLVGSINNEIENNIYSESIIPIPKQAFFVRFTMPKGKDWTAVLSVDKI